MWYTRWQVLTLILCFQWEEPKFPTLRECYSVENYRLKLTGGEGRGPLLSQPKPWKNTSGKGYSARGRSGDVGKTNRRKIVKVHSFSHSEVEMLWLQPRIRLQNQIFSIFWNQLQWCNQLQMAVFLPQLTFSALFVMNNDECRVLKLPYWNWRHQGRQFQP